jgi:sugar/nucleoside kinase (ribokinase family)
MKDHLNKDIQLCGIGNALVDIQLEVNESELTSTGYEKGTMTLVDRAAQTESIEKLSDKEKHLSSGGSAANTIIAYSSFGGKAAYQTALGNDELGRFYSDEFKKLGIVLANTTSQNDPTGSCLLYITPDAERTQATYLGANEIYGMDDIDDETIARSEWLYIEGYKLSSDSGFEAVTRSIEIAKAKCTRIALTLSDKFIVDVFRSRIDDIYGDMDLIFCNDLEARTYTETDNNEAAYKALKDKQANFAITMGAEGSKLYYDGDNIGIDPVNAAALDSTGAGDMYAAGFFYGLTHGRKPHLAGKLGSLAASKIVSQYGARLKSSHTELRDKVFQESKIFA